MNSENITASIATNGEPCVKSNSQKGKRKVASKPFDLAAWIAAVAAVVALLWGFYVYIFPSPMDPHDGMYAKIRVYMGNIEQAVLAGKRNDPETDKLYWQPFVGFIRGSVDDSDLPKAVISAIHHFKEVYQSLPPLGSCKPEALSQAKALVSSCMTASSSNCKAKDFDALRSACPKLTIALPDYDHR